MALKHMLSAVAVTLLLASLVGLGHYGWRWWQIERYNSAIAVGDYTAAGRGRLPHNAFARAYDLQQQGKLFDALVLYHELAEQGPTELAGYARFNLANLHLHQALQVEGSEARDLLLPLVELAKTAYREQLRLDSGDWLAKYNLERALQLLPDPRVQAARDPQAPLRGPRSVIRIEAESQGLP